MRRTELLQEIRKMRFEQAYAGWNGGRLTQDEAAVLLGVCERSFRRFVLRFEADVRISAHRRRSFQTIVDGVSS